ncbi:MAG: DUF4238 domain-containing protein [Snowella sp.]|nr:DUF4238 domain-containing protein [Snowella sp.]
MSFEKTQKRNPHSLTVNQHTFSNASIKRFANSNGKVCVFHKPTGRLIPEMAPTNSLFCAKRQWDQASEDTTKKIEDAFQSLADQIVSTKISSIGPVEKKIVNDFYSLWNIRVHIKNNPIPEQKLDGIIRLPVNLTKDEQEFLEKEHITPIRQDCTISGRHFAGSLIQKFLYEDRERLKDNEWGIIKAKIGEFLVPDQSFCKIFLPLSPTLCLLSQSANTIIDEEKVAQINRYVFDQSIEYFFAHDFENCPILSCPNDSREKSYILTVDQLLKTNIKSIKK